MNSRLPELTMSLLAFATCLTSSSSAQDARRTNPNTLPATTAVAGSTFAGPMDLSQGVYVASLDVEDRSLRRYVGEKLFNTEGAELGIVKEFIVHPATSRVRYLVVSSGGILRGMGNSLRLVPFEALRPSSRGHVFEVDILHADFLQLPPVSDEVFVADGFNISAAQHQEMVRRFGAGDPGLSSIRPRENEFAGVIRASLIRGTAVHVANRKVGDIENIIIDLARGTASALLDASGDFTGTKAKYLVPLSRLAFTSPRQDPISTTLTRADFDQARPVNFGLSATTAATGIQAVSEPPLTPTGRTTAPVIVEQSADPLAASARAIRQALNNDPILVAEQVSVNTENGRIVLRGSVRNETTRRNLENAARRAVPAANIENQITVTNR